MRQKLTTEEKKAFKLMKKEEIKQEYLEAERVAKKQKIDNIERKKVHAQTKAAIKADRPNQKRFEQEMKDFIKNDKKNISKRVMEIKNWYKSEKNKNSNIKSSYKWKLQVAKRPNFDFSGNIKFENVSYTYGISTPFEFKALDNIESLEIEPKKITAVIGMTGSGKSTLIQLTNGLIMSDTGRTIVGEYQLHPTMKKITEVKPLRKEIGLVFQFPEYQLFQDTIEKDIAFGPINLGGNKNEVFKEIPNLLKLVDLPESYAKRSPFDLSGGQKRRVAIAGIIATDGNTLVLDEPTGGLDPQGEEDFMRIFSSLNKEKGKRIIIVTHNMDHVLQIADKVIVMDKGRVIEHTTPFKVFSNEDLLNKIKIEPPKVYKLAFKLKEKGLDVTKEEFRNIKELAQAIKKVKG